MSLFYAAAYWVGLKPWELMATLPIRDQISALFEREEDGRMPPFGPALDLGCGTGIWSVKLAARGWQVTGVEIIGRALRAARERARNASVEVQLIHGDITALRAAGVDCGFRFVLDFGAVHGLNDKERAAVGREVNAVAAADATVLMLAWAPARRGPLPHGASRRDIKALFPGWTIIDEDKCDVAGAPRFIRKADPRFYRLRRN
jgi:SAM-dependent methyltransferase